MTAFRFAILGLLILASGLYAQPIVTIRDIQFTTDTLGNSPYAGTTVITGGIVTATNYSNSALRYFLGDSLGGPWHGIYVVDITDRQIEVGDSVRLQGEVYESSGETRLRNINATNYTRVDNVRQIPPFPVTTGGFASAEAYEGVLVEIQSVQVTAVGTSTWEVDDGTGACVVGSGFDYSYEPTVGEQLLSIRGMVVFASGAFRLEPRGDFDFTFLSNQPPAITDVSRNPENPNALQKVLITARIYDQSGVADARLRYKTSESQTWTDSLLYDDGLHGDGVAHDNIYGALIPEFQAFTQVQYYIFAADSQELTSFSPADAPEGFYSYIVRSTTLTVFDIQYTPGPGDASPLNGELVTLEDVVVTAVNYDGSNFFVSDPVPGSWRGVYVYGSGSTVNVGDHVRFSARVQEYYGTTELSSLTGLTVLSTGNVPLPPLQICATALNPGSGEEYEGCFVEFGPGMVTTTADDYGQFRYNDDCGTIVVDDGFAYGYEAMPGDSMTFLRGMVTYHSATGHKLDPRGDFDIGLIDKRPPTLVEARAISYLQVNVQFNEALDSISAVNPENYTLTDFTAPETPLDLRSVRLFSSQKTVALEPWDSLKTGYTYTLKVSGIKDTTGNVILPDSAQSVQFTGFSPLAYASVDSFYNFFELFRNKICTVCGVVTFVQDVTTTGGSRRISAYVQDVSGYGLNLSESGAASNFPQIQRGNLIEITGTVSEYDGSLQMGGFTTEVAFRVLSEDMPLPQPIKIKTGDRYTQQRLIRTSVSSVLGSGTWCEVAGTILRVDENVGGGTNIYIDDGSGNVTIRVWDDMNLHSVVLDSTTYAMRDLVGKTCSVAGVTGQYLGDFQMLAGYAEDFSVAQPTGIPSSEAVLSVEAKPFAPDIGQEIKMSYNAPVGAQVRLRIFNLRGQLVTTLVNKTSVGPFTISWNGTNELRELVPLGTYIVHFESELNGKTTTAMKPVVVGTRLK
jgi:DNA/RNA endonuclease YhcR with UshA esterase domain